MLKRGRDSTDQASIGLIGVVNSTLQEIVIEASSVMVCLNFAVHVVGENRPRANMLFNVFTPIPQKSSQAFMCKSQLKLYDPWLLQHTQL